MHVANSLFLGKSAGELTAFGESWPHPPGPCGVIAGTKRMSIVPTSWIMILLQYFRVVGGVNPCVNASFFSDA